MNQNDIRPVNSPLSYGRQMITTCRFVLHTKFEKCLASNGLKKTVSHEENTRRNNFNHQSITHATEPR